MKKDLLFKRALRSALLVLLLSVVGMEEGIAQSFTIGDLNYTVNSDGTTVTLTGPLYGTDDYSGSLNIPESVSYNGTDYAITAIGANAFNNCLGLTELTIGSSITTIGDWAFGGCSGLEGDLVIPNSVTTIGEGAFASCGFTGTLTLPNSITTISNNAFASCWRFTGTLTIPNSVVTIGDWAFCFCEMFTGLTIGNSVTTIGNNAFAICTGFSGSLVIPNSVTTIGESAFLSCWHFTGTLTIPNSVTTIGDEAFGSCEGFVGTLTIPNSVISIDGNAFAYCNGIDQITVDAGNPVYDSRNNCNGIIETATNTLISACKSTVIPNTVVSIGYYAFAGCDMTSISIPNSVSNIDFFAFSHCPNLTSIVIPSSVTTIGGALFNACDNLEQIIVESGNPVYDSRDNSNAIIESSTNVLISGCMNTVIPNTVTAIGRLAFANCSNLTSIAIPSSVTNIGNEAFIGSGLTGDLVIPNSVSSIEGFAFYSCCDLNGDLFLGNSLTQIGQNAFCDCNIKKVIAIANIPPALHSMAFGYDVMDQLIVSCGNKDAYEASDWFNYFSTINEDCNSYSVTVENGTGGVVSTSANSALLGEEISISYIAEPGHELNSVKVYKPDDETKMVPCNNNSFVMPNFAVVVKPSFVFTSVDENDNVAISVYPNPAKGMVKIEAEGMRSVAIFILIGQHIFKSQATGNEFKFDFSGYDTGVYLIRIETSNGVATKRVILTK